MTLYFCLKKENPKLNVRVFDIEEQKLVFTGTKEEIYNGKNNWLYNAVVEKIVSSANKKILYCIFPTPPAGERISIPKRNIISFKREEDEDDEELLAA